MKQENKLVFVCFMGICGWVIVFLILGICMCNSGSFIFSAGMELPGEFLVTTFILVVMISFSISILKK